MNTSSILEKLNTLNSNNAPGTREEMLRLAHSLASSLETPSEVISRVGWAEPAGFACMRIAVELHVFQKLQDSKSAMSAQQIADETGSDVTFISRMLKHLTAMNILAEVGVDRFTNTRVSSQFIESKYSDGITYCYDVAGPSFRSMPTYFAQTKYVNPTNPISGPFQHAHSTPLHFFPWLGAHPKYLTAFGNYMTGYRAGKPSWMDAGFYPVETLTAGVGADDILLVDVGGGQGHDLLELRAKHPGLPGRLILQDKPEVVGALALDDVEAQGHDFFTAQPVRGARAYFLHSVLHDWDDEACLRILGQLRPAMQGGKLLVHELVVPDEGASWAITSMDWLMMGLGSVRERTEADWRGLLGKAGFKVLKVWSVEQGTESLIEAVVDAA